MAISVALMCFRLIKSISLGDSPISFQSKSPSNSIGLPALSVPENLLFRSVISCCRCPAVRLVAKPSESLGLNITAPDGLAPLLRRLMLCLLDRLCWSTSTAAALSGDRP